MKISVLIPVYNSDKYLSRCIDSILTQNIYELILVNDGSKDSSGSICELYAKQDKRIQVFHQENKGVSAARNLALEKATGERIAFVDADDYVEKDWIEILTNALKSEESEIYFYGYRSIHSDSIEESLPDKGSMEAKEFVESSFYHQAVWSYLFRTSLIRENGIIFPVELKYSEDQAFLLKYLSLCRNVILIHNILYNYYCVNYDSAVFQTINAVRITYNLKAANDFLEFCCHKKAGIHDFAVWRLYEDYFLFYPKIKKEYRKECQELYNAEYKKTTHYYPEFRKHSYFRLSSYN